MDYCHYPHSAVETPKLSVCGGYELLQEKLIAWCLVHEKHPHFSCHYSHHRYSLSLLHLLLLLQLVFIQLTGDVVQIRTQIHVLPKCMSFIISWSLCPEISNQDGERAESWYIWRTVNRREVFSRVQIRLGGGKTVFSVAVEDPTVTKPRRGRCWTPLRVRGHSPFWPVMKWDLPHSCLCSCPWQS